MKVVYFSKYSDCGPSSRYRVFQFLDGFARAGLDFHIYPLFEDPYFEILRMPPSRARTLKKIRYVAGRFQERRKQLQQSSAPLCVIEQQLFPYIPFLVEKRFLPARYLLEFDDAIYLTHPHKLPQILRQAAGVLAGNKTLAGYASRYNRQVHVVPTVLDTDIFHPAPKPHTAKIRIGWSGLEYNFRYLRTLAPVFLKLQTLYPVEVVILTGSLPRDLPFPFRFEKWNPRQEAEQINQFDIGVMPLEMNEWCRGKCGIKLLQYMSLEIPSVATPAGVNAEIIREGENGFTAVTLSEWEQRLTTLIEDEPLRKEMGKAARETVVKEYSREVWFPRILETYKQYA